ncbi:ATP-binding protein [Caproicibacter sp.]|uniref:ATP-binding protein n=1 Tax=Caproicibacter sp. TaxID=2814884 RepID=UPI00398919A3
MVDLNNFDEPANGRNRISVVNEDTYELNIQPAASILNVFSRLSYKAWYAIAEFVDNSTQSYLSHIEELNGHSDIRLVVKVRYSIEYNTLTITDNAYGMEIEKFKDAILLDSKNNEQVGRHEFGMGLKTAASWFGNIWSVKSTQYGSSNEFNATVNIPKLKNEGLNSVRIHRSIVDENKHGTTITISEVTKKITGPRTIAKIRDLLSSMYRRDINNKNIEIWFNDEPIAFDDYTILTNFRGKTWKKPLDFTIIFDTKNYHITGFVAIMNPGSFPKAGFALFRQDRVVIGGTDANYKPMQIFGQIQSQRSLKLFGELNMDDFPVNQAKDGFIWDDGLEDVFIEALKMNIQDYIEIADLSRKERESESQYSTENSNKLQKEIEKAIEGLNGNDDSFDPNGEYPYAPINNSDDKTSLDTKEYIETILNIETEATVVGTVRTYNVPINQITTQRVNVQWAVGKLNYWIDYSENENGEIDVQINIDHPFFMPYAKDENFKKVLEKFVLSFIIAEQQARLTSDKEGYIMAATIKNYMNKYLSKMAGE